MLEPPDDAASQGFQNRFTVHASKWSKWPLVSAFNANSLPTSKIRSTPTRSFHAGANSQAKPIPNKAFVLLSVGA